MGLMLIINPEPEPDTASDILVKACYTYCTSFGIVRGSQRYSASVVPLADSMGTALI